MLPLCIVILTLLATAACREEFHCKFENNYYKIKRDGSESGPYLWGNDVQALEFQDKKGLLDEKRRLDKYKQEYYKEFSFNSFKSYMSVYNAMKGFLSSKSIGPGEFKNKSLIAQFNDVFEPNMKEVYSDQLVMMVNLYKDIVGKEESLKENFFMGVAGGTPKDVERIRQNTDEAPVALLENESIIGVIKVSVKGTLGYVIIDMEYPGKETPLVMADDEPVPESFKLNDKFGSAIEKPMKYQLIGKNKNFIEVVRFRYDEGQKLFVRDTSDLIYVGRPLCSFVETHVRKTLLYTTTLSFVKYFSVDHEYLIDAYIYADLKPKPTRRFEVGHVVNHEGPWMYNKIEFDNLESLERNNDSMNVFKKAVANFRSSELVLKEMIGQFEDFYKKEYTHVEYKHDEYVPEDKKTSGIVPEENRSSYTIPEDENTSLRKKFVASKTPFRLFAWRRLNLPVEEDLNAQKRKN